MKDNHKQRSWTQLQAESSWSIFKIMAEFVEGYERMNQIGPCVSIYGSARTKPENPYYQQAVDCASQFVDAGYGIITGGGPGIMEAANKGAQEAKGKSVGLNIELPFEQSANPYIDLDKLLNFHYFFVRKVMFVKYAQAFILFPGGFGTLDELFESFTLIQTEKITRVPTILIGSQYWDGLVDWIRETMLEKEGNISPDDMDLLRVTDSVEEAVAIVNEFYSGTELKPNF